ncbi:MAG TPA: tetratricopeptide repeat protein [Epulopiscium sp.]|nr:tetratricopeptide repeat protein [Candidatus Epulonipiscium sp.]
MGWSNQVERNLQAIEYEKNGNIEKAIELYEQNVDENFDGTHPYERLSELYLSSGQNEDLIRVLEKALMVFEGAHFGDCQHKYTQLERFKQMHENFKSVLETVN